MSIVRYGDGNLKGSGGQRLPFARATQADGWLYVSGQVGGENGTIVPGGIEAESHKAIQNMMDIVHEAGYAAKDILRIGVWLHDPRDFWRFNAVFAEYFGEHPPARACVQSALMIDGKVEVDCIAYKAD
jgi:reactive intermediate/imine deaminase